MAKEVAIITVTYNPNISELTSNVLSYLNQVGLVNIVDNSDNIILQEEVKLAFEKYKNVVVITLGKNYGIAKAQNIGFNYLMQKGFQYFVEVDQDSVLPKNYIDNILESYINLKKTNRNIAGVGPLAVSKGNGSIYMFKHTKKQKNCFEVSETLSSGFLTTKSVIDLVGERDESLFIDLVDWEWFWRAKSLGLKIFIDSKLKIIHSLGLGHKNFFMFKAGIPTPIRHYYQYRNSLILMTKSYVPFLWKLKRITIHLFKPILIILFYDKKLVRLKYMYLGVKDYMKNKQYGKQ